MKRLNLNNTIATTAMLTKTNAMKNKMNLFAKVVMMMGIMLTQNNIFAATPVKNGNTWYSYYHSSEVSKTPAGAISVDLLMNQEVYPPCSDRMSYEYKNAKVLVTGNANLEAKYYYGSNSTITDESSHNNSSWTWSNDSHYLGKIPENTYKFDIRITSGAFTFYMRNISIPLKSHIRLYDSTNANSNRDGGTTNLTINEINDPNHVKVGQAKEIIIPFRSFLTNGDITVKMANGDPNVFRVNNSSTDCTTSKSYKVYNGGADKCGTMEGTGDYTNTPGSATACNIHVFFYPQNTTQQSATFTITDGTSTATATINAIGADNTMSFETFVQIPSASQKFEMTNFTGNVSVSAPDPFEVSTNNSTWLKNITVSNNTFYVRFAPTTANADEQIYNDVVTMTSNGTTYNLNVSGKAKKQQATISWNVPQQDLILPLNSMYPLKAKFLGDLVTDYSTSDNSVIDIVQNDGAYYIEAKGTAGQSATITASADGTGVYTKPADVSYTFTISPKTVQYIKWDQDLSNLKMASATTPLPVTLTAIACDKGSETDNTNSVTYSYSTDGTNFTGISGSTMTFSSKGTYYLKAYTDETGDDQSGYLSAEMVRTVIVRIEGESCLQYSLMPTDINSSNDVPCNLNGLPGTMSGTLHYGTVTQVNVTINPNSLWHYKYGDALGWTWGDSGDEPISVTAANMQNYSSITVHSDHGDFNKNLKISGLTVAQQTYFNKGGAATNTIPFGDVTVGVTSGAQTFTLNFANVPEIEIVPTSGNTDQFTVTRTNVSSKNKVGGPDVNTVECNCFGNATYSVTFHPTSSGDKRAEYIFKAAIEGADGGYVEFKLTVTGKGTRKSQSLSWDNSHSLFTTSLNALSGTIDLTGAAVSYDGSNPTGLTPTYSLSNVTPAGAVELTDNGTKLKINTYGSFVLNANQSGEGSNYEAAQTLTHEAINISRVTPHLAWVTTPDNSTEVFQMVTVSATTNDTQGEIGNITYSFEPASAGSVTNDGQLTLINREAATLYATISETGTYSAGTIPHTFTPAKVTPVLQCSIQSLERTALTNLYLTEMPVTITNSTTLWHDIAVTYSSDNESIAKFEGDHFSLLKSGSCTITAKVNAGVNNKASSNTIEIPLTVNNASQSITWNDNLTGPYNVNQAAVGPLTATASSGMTVNYSDGGKGIVSIGSDKKISFIKAGYATITASQPGDERSSAAGNVTKSFKVDFEVGKTFTFTGENVLVDGSKEETFDMTGLFVSSGESYTVTSSSPEFIIENATITSNKITIKFEPKTVENGNDTEEKTSIITITDNGQTYSFKVKATAEKKDAGLTLRFEGETFAFSTITLSHSEATDAEVTLSASIGNIEDNTYKFRSTEQVTITATTPANQRFKADSKTLNFTPKAVKPKIINWGGSYGAQKVGVSCPLGQADWDVDETVSGQPDKEEWEDEVTIIYSSSNEDIAKINGNNLEFGKAGLAIITATINAGDNHNGATKGETRTVKVDFAEAGVVCGPAYAGETPATYDITDMIVPEGQLSYSTENTDFSVDFSDNKIVVVYNPTVYVASCTAEITLTDAGNGEVYHLNVRGECQKHMPEIVWRDNRALQIATDRSMILTAEDLINTTLSKDYTPLTIASSDNDIIEVYDENYQLLAAGTPGKYILPVGKGTAGLTAYVGETESHTAFTSVPEPPFTVSGTAQSRIAWSQNLRFMNTVGTVNLTAQVQKLSTSEPISGASVTYHIVNNPDNVVSLTNGNSSPLIVNAGTEGTAQIYAEFAGNEDYLSCVSETLTIKIVAPASGGRCEKIEYAVVTSGNPTYYFNRSHNTTPGEPYFEVESIEYDFHVTGDDASTTAWIFHGDGDDKFIYATFGGKTKTYKGPGGKGNGISLEAAKADEITGSDHFNYDEVSDVPQSISFTGDIGTHNSRFENIYVTMKSFFRQNTNFSNPFAGKTTMVDETETVNNINLGKYSNLSACEVKLWDAEMDREYEGEEFTIIDGISDNYPKGCNDYGDLIISIAFKPKSGIPGITHKCRVRVTFTYGTSGDTHEYTGFLIEGTAERYEQGDIIWNQDAELNALKSLSTKPTGAEWESQNPFQLIAKSALEDIYHEHVVVDYDIDPTSDEGVAEIVEGNKLSIKKAGHIVINASHPGDRKYKPASTSRELNIPRSEPTIVLSYNDNNNNTPIAEGSTISVTYNEPQYTISGKALYGDFEIYGYNVGGKIKLSSSASDVVEIESGNQLQFLKSGDAVITATITEDDVVFGKTFTFNVHVDKAPAGLHWNDESNYTDGWMYVFDTKQMTAVAGNDDNTGEITYEVTSGDADIDANGIITLRKFESITVKAKIAETDKYFADDITISFIPTKVTPVVTWDNTNLTTDKSQTTYTIADNDLATVSAVSQIPMQPSVDKWVDGKEITYSVESDNGVITLQNGHTFTINKAGQATIMAKVIAGGNNNASSNSPTRKLKVDFDPSSPIYCGEAVVFGTCTTTVNLGDIMAIEGNITVSVQNNDEFKAYFHPEDNELIITYSPKSIKEPNPTEAIVAITDGNEVQYKLHVTGKALPYTPIFLVSETKHDNWVFETTPNKAKSEIIYGYDNSSDIYWSNTDGIAIQEAATELAKVQLSLKDATDAEYVEIDDNGRDFRVKQAKADSDEDFTVVIVASYPGLEGKMEPSSVEIPITITKTKYSLNWNRAEGFEIEIYQHSKQLAAPTQTPEGGESAITYSFSEEGIGTYEGTIFTLPDNPPYKSGKLIASIASDKYAKGTSAELDIKVKKTEQTVTWAGDEIISGFTTQKSIEEGIQLTAEAYRGSTTKTNANIRYEVTENSNCNGEGNLIHLDVNKNVSPWITTLYYTGNGSGVVSIKAIAEETDEFNESKADDPNASPVVIFNITKEGCTVNSWTVSDMHYGDRVVLEPTVDKSTRGTNYEYTLPSVTGTLETAGNVLDAKGVGNGLTISAKKLEDCWVNESEGSTASNTFNIAKSEQEIEWDKTVLGTPQEGAYHFTVLDNTEYQLGTQTIDKLHKDADATCLTLVDGKYVTANISGDAPGGLSLVYSIVEQDVCKVGEDKIVSVDNEGKMHITGNGTGTVLVIASVDGEDYYENVSETITVVVDKATPPFTWNVPESNWNVTYGEAINTVKVTTDGDGVITLSSSNTDVATIDNYGNITINGAGTTVITATLAEGCKYFAANETLTQTLTVNKAATSFAITKLELTYGDKDMAFSVTNDNGLTEGQYTMTITNIDGVNIRMNATNQTHIDAIHANSENIKVGLKFSDMANYADVETTAVVTVAKCPVEIVWNQDLSIELANQTTINHKEGFALTATINDTKHNIDVSNETAATFGFTESGTSEGCTPLVEINNYVLSVTGNGAGTVTVTASYAESDNFLAANSVEQSFTITKVDPEVTMETIANVTCGATGTLGATANHGGKEGFTFESSNTDTATVSDNTFTALHAGTVRFRVTKAATCTTNEQTSDYVVATIDKADQTVTWNNSESETLLATDMTNGIVLSATATSNITHQATGTQISYSITSGGNLAQIVEDNRLVSLGAGTGTVTIKATAGTTVNEYEDYNEASQEITFDVVPDNITFTVAQLDLTYGDEDMAFSVTNDKGLTEGQYTMTITNINNTYLRANAGNANHIDAIHAHSEDIEVDLKFSGMTNYADVETTAVVTVAKCPVEIVWNQDLSTELGDQTTISHTTGYTLTATIKDTKHNKDVSSEAAATFGFTMSDITEGCTPIVTLNGNSLSVTGNGAGTVTVIASYAESDNFLAATSVVEKSFTITKADPQFNWAVAGDLNATYGDNNVTATTTHDGTGTVTYSSSEEDVATINPSTGAITLLKQGETTIYADLAPTCQYEGGKITKKLTVGRKERALNWSTAPRDMIYGSTQTVVATPSEGEGTITYSIDGNTHATIDSSTGEITTIGVTTMPITVTATIGATDQYETASVTGTFNITPATATFDWGGEWSSAVAKEMYYQASETLSVVCQTEGYSDYSVTYSVAEGDGQYVSITNDVVTVTEVKGTGNVTVTATIHDNDGNYSDVVLTTEIHTNKTDAPTGTFSFSDVTLTYNGAGENLDGHISCTEEGMSYDISSYTINPPDGANYVSLGGSDNKTLSPVNATNGATVTVTAHITGMTNYNDCDVTGNVTVNKGTQTITWNEDKNYTVSNTKDSINLSEYCTLTQGEGTITFTSLDTTVAKVLGNYLVIKEITTQRNVNITATVAGTDNYEKATADTVFTITVETLKITIGNNYNGKTINLASTKKKVSSVTNDVDFAKLLIDEGILICNYESATYTFVPSDPTVATFNENGMIIAYKKADDLEIEVTAHVGEMEASTTLHFKIPRGVMEFKNNGNWHDNGKWVRTDMLPSAEDHDVSIQANCIIQDDSTAVCYNLNITDSGSLSVSPNAVLNVTDTITNSEASKLTLKANENHSATVLFATGSPSATVENYIQGGLHSEGEGENRINNPDWQYRGFVGDNPSLSNWNVVIFKWDETKNNGDCWGKNPVYEKTGSYSGSPWVGYSMANYDTVNPVRNYTSKLIPSDTTMTYNLSYTYHGQEYPNLGVNLITNSWSAPINISDVNFSGDVESTIYFYRTRNYNTWNSNRGAAFETCPIKTANVVANYPMIASSQSFLVRAKGSNASLTINGDSLAHEANGAMYAPAEKERFNVLSITMSNDTMADRVFLLESENCSRAFDNGYDGTKIKEGNMPQIFASNDFGHTAVNTDKTMLGQRIGYSAAKDGALCTITFNTDRLDGFSELYLYDRVAKRYANILAGDSYSFTGTKAGEEERFEIVGRRDDGSEFVSSSDMMIEVIGNKALLSGFAGGNDEVFITDMNGKRIWTERASNGPWFELPNLPAGVYLINCGEANCKFIVK